MRTLTILLTIFMQAFVMPAAATVRYASPTGADAEGLSASRPGALRNMVERLQPGDTLYLLGGQYDETNTLVVNIRATADKWVTICAAKECLMVNGQCSMAKPVFDFRQQPNGTNGVKVTGEYIHIKDITIRYAGKKGIWLENASHCILERIEAYGCCDSGIQLRKGGYNVVVNCDSHDNFDYQDKGGNADGFADKQGGAAFPGNTYIGCRAWHNSDDGWDSFQRETKDTPTVYLFCAAFNNGPAEFDLSAHPRANGVDRELPCMEGKDLRHFPNSGNPNGFKFGGQGKDNKASGIYTRHDTEASHCLAVGHRSKGFDQNNNAGRMKVSHCLAVDNDINYGFGNPYPCSLDIRHCVSIKPGSGEHLVTAPECSVTQEGNSWNDNDNLDLNLNDNLNLDGVEIVRAMMARRQANGALPEDLLKILNSL